MKNPKPQGKMEFKRPFWLFGIPDGRRCQAKSKQTGEQCKNWACKGKTKCKFHGGMTPKKTPEAIEAIKQMNTKHGRYSLDVLKSRMVKRMTPKLIARNLNDFTVKHIIYRIGLMNIKEYRVFRQAIKQYLNGEIIVTRLIEIIENKPDGAYLKMEKMCYYKNPKTGDFKKI